MPSAAPSRTCGPTRTGSHVRSIRSAASALGLVSVLVLGAVGAGPSQASVGPVESARPSASTPADPTAAIRAYVTQVYEDLFGRAPDAGGLATWTAQLAAGVPYAAVANAITSSTEYRSRLIAGAYTRYLGRAPDASGVQFWLGQMAGGRQIEQIEAGFVASQEFYERGGGTDRGWVTLLYRTVLDRAPSTAEVDWWAGAIGRGMNRGAVALGFLYSTEHLVTVVDGYYVDLLHRHIDPSGSATWVGLIQSGSRDEEIIAAIVSSSEYRNRVGAVATPVRLDVDGGPVTCVDGALVGGSIGWDLPLTPGIASIQLYRGDTFVSREPESGLAAGSYTLRVQVAPGYVLTNRGATDHGDGLYDVAWTIPSFDGPCTPSPGEVRLDLGGGPRCVGYTYAGSSIEWDVPLQSGITSVSVYLGTTLIGNAPAHDLAPGRYTVRVQVAEGYTLTNSGATDRGNGTYDIDWDVPDVDCMSLRTPVTLGVVATPQTCVDGAPVGGTIAWPTPLPAGIEWAAVYNNGGYVSAGPTSLLVPGTYTLRARISAGYRLTDPGAAYQPTVGEFHVPVDVAPDASGSCPRPVSAARVSLASDGSEGDGDSSEPSASADGRWVAYISTSANLVPGDTNMSQDVFVTDRTTGTTSLVSVASDGGPADRPSVHPVISGDGRWVAFASPATNIVAADENSDIDVFVADLTSGTVELVSEAADGGSSDGGSDSPSISADGRWIAFASSATDLVAGGTSGRGEVFVRDRLTGTTTLVPTPDQGLCQGELADAPSISADGRAVAFASACGYVYLWDRETGLTVLVSADKSGRPAGRSTGPSVSADGRWVAFTTDSDTIIDGTNFSHTAVVVWDRLDNTVSLVSAGQDGSPGNSPTSGASISADGRRITYSSQASNLAGGSRNGQWDAFLTDRDSGVTTLISGAPGGRTANGPAYGGAISADGGWAVFVSAATNLVAGDENRREDAFIVELP